MAWASPARPNCSTMVRINCPAASTGKTTCSHPFFPYHFPPALGAFPRKIRSPYSPLNLKLEEKSFHLGWVDWPDFGMLRRLVHRGPVRTHRHRVSRETYMHHVPRWNCAAPGLHRSDHPCLGKIARSAKRITEPWLRGGLFHRLNSSASLLQA